MYMQVDGRFRHTANSEFLRTSPYTAMAETTLDDCFKASSETNTWLEKAPRSMSVEDNPFFTRCKYFVSFHGDSCFCFFVRSHILG